MERGACVGLAVAAALGVVQAVPALGQVRLGAEFRVNSYTTSVQFSPRVAAGATGSFVVVWSSFGQDGDAYGIFGQRYDASGAPQGAEFRVNSHTTLSQTFPNVAADAAGNFVVVWQSYGQDGSNLGVFGQRYDAAGAPQGGEFQVNAFTIAYQALPAVASDASGSFVVVWNSYGQDGSGRGVFARRYDAAGTPQGTEFQVNSYTTSNQYRPRVGRDTAGGFVVVWQSLGEDGNGYGIFGQRYDAAGTAQGTEFRANSYTTAAQVFPRVASDATGGFVVAWQSYGQDGSLSGVFAQRYDAAGTPQGGELLVNSYTPSNQQRPSVASDAAGSFVVVWHSSGQDGSSQGVFGRRYDATGAAQGAEFQVNSYTTSYQTDASVASDPTGNFVVVWQSAGQDGGDSGVFGQRYDPDLIFADGFESGDLSAWSTFSETGGGDLAPSGASALGATATGLQALVDDTAALYVRDDSPAGEGRYRARFYFDPNGFDPGEAQGHRRVRILIGFAEAPVKRHIAVVLRRVSGQYGLQGRVRLDDNSQIDTGFFDVTDAPHFVEVDWRRATDAMSNDGSFEMWIDGVSVSSLTNLSDSLRPVDFVRLGPQSLKGGAAGTLYFDEFESRRLRMIGP
jgi:hypothetical protein